MELHPGAEKRRPAATGLTEYDPSHRALRENEDWYQSLAEHSHDLLYTHDLTGRLLAVNAVAARLLGYSVEELLHIPTRELVAPDFRAHFDASLTEIARSGEARGFLAMKTRTGERRIWRYCHTLREEGMAAPVVRGIATRCDRADTCGKTVDCGW